VSLRTNLFLATVASLGFATVCAVCSAQLDREGRAIRAAFAIGGVGTIEPVVTGSSSGITGFTAAKAEARAGPRFRAAGRAPGRADGDEAEALRRPVSPASRSESRAGSGFGFASLRASFAVSAFLASIFSGRARPSIPSGWPRSWPSRR
jgi:hypothetical protein